MMRINSSPYIRLATDDIGEPAKANLSKHSTARSGNLDGSVWRGPGCVRLFLVDSGCRSASRRRPTWLVTKIDGENVVGISEEANTGDDDGSDMVPAETGEPVRYCMYEEDVETYGSLIDLS